MAHVIIPDTREWSLPGSLCTIGASLPVETSCALQYILVHLLGYKLSIDDLKAFRQIDSLTPGHPEAHHTDGNTTVTNPQSHALTAICI